MSGSLLHRLRTWKDRQRFFPGALGMFVNPFYIARRGLLAGLREFAPHLQGHVLDVGCGSKPYRELIPATRYVGMEMDTPRARSSFAADVYYDGRTFPFPEATFDGVLCSQVFEHVFNPAEFLAEVSRVLKPGGRLVLTVPFVWDEHEQPHDFARYSSFALQALLADAGLIVDVHRKSVANSALIFQLVNAYLYKVTLTAHPRVNLLAAAVLMGPVNIAGAVCGWLLPDNPDLYLDHVVLARKAGIVASPP